ncbi:MAG: adenylate/guanylate cyclase domain-containing protein [Anaerolineae bacterium]|nr:adenylate/guanylate cyclase domain-containing protein [Anaerolineae bacterium]MDQ7037107.1 adenylate/guanylate cyclase domain-containing protein [Anaerolineae bacterium]
MKILVVDDNRENIELVRDILEMAGHTVSEALDGSKALAMLPQDNPALILLDINMPGMDGFEVCKRLKANEETRNIPVIMLTAQSDVESRVVGLSTGADDYLAKPFSPRELVARVERSLRSKSRTDDLISKQEQLRQTFSRFVAAPVVEQLLKNPDQVKLGGSLQQITVVFADLQGFTALSEHTEPEDLLHLLNRYHTFMAKILLQYGGTIDKFLGDGLMALYNTPVKQEDHIARAVKTVLHMQDELYWFWQDLPEKHRTKINFGIHTGKAIVGNVGSENLMDFTAIGDTVNIAARLQGVADNGEILVSSAVYEATKGFVFGRSRGEITVKGRKTLVDTYQISNTYFE